MKDRSESKKYICIDVGGTAIKHGILCEDETFLKKGSVETPPDGRAILKSVHQIVEVELNEYLTGGKTPLPVGVCISSAGMVDSKNGSIFYSGPTIHNFAGTQYKKTIEERFHLPCEAENDVNCAGLAEYHSGAAKGHECALVLTVGTGIGGCVFIDGHIHHGVTNSAGEVGYMRFAKDDFQDLASTNALIKKVASLRKESDDLWDGKKIFEEAKAGDRMCETAIDDMCKSLGYGIANICYVLNPSVCVIGGGIMAQAEYLIPRIRTAMEEILPQVIAGATKLTSAHHQNDAGMIGAYYHFLEMQKKRNGKQ